MHRRTFPRYERAWLGSDLVAGVTLAAYAVPVSLAYATLAGLRPEMGLYCYLLAGLGYAIFGSSRHLAVIRRSWCAIAFPAAVHRGAMTASSTSMDSRRFRESDLTERGAKPYTRWIRCSAK